MKTTPRGAQWPRFRRGLNIVLAIRTVNPIPMQHRLAQSELPIKDSRPAVMLVSRPLVSGKADRTSKEWRSRQYSFAESCEITPHGLVAYLYEQRNARRAPKKNEYFQVSYASQGIDRPEGPQLGQARSSRSFVARCAEMTQVDQYRNNSA